MLKSFKILFICFLASSTSLAYAISKDCQPIPVQNIGLNLKEQVRTERIPHPHIDVRHVVSVFLDSVEKGELIIFEMRIDKSIIKPERVEYIYKLTDRTPTVKVYSTLTKPIPVPALPDVPIKGVSAVINQEGRIIEAVVHCGV